jgi:hypothetical protein
MLVAFKSLRPTCVPGVKDLYNTDWKVNVERIYMYKWSVSVNGMHKVNKRKTRENVIIKNLGTFPSSFQTKY